MTTFLVQPAVPQLLCRSPSHRISLSFTSSVITHTWAASSYVTRLRWALTSALAITGPYNRVELCNHCRDL